MRCAVAAATSPAFSPSPRASPSSCRSSVSSPVNLGFHASSPMTPSSPQPSPLTFQLHKQMSGYSWDSEEFCSSSSAPSPQMPMVLKRKRPARIDIPAASVSFAEFGAQLAAERLNEVQVEEKEYSVYCKRGKRRDLEDRYSAMLNLQGDSKQAFFGIFDGHGGEKAAAFVAENIGRNIIEEVTRRCGDEIEEAVKEGYLTTDAEFLKTDVGGGTCCLTALLRNGDLVVSNAGDCRAVMSRGGAAEVLTVDHRPSRDDERDRIENLGGYVDCCNGVWRVQGSLAVSRALGDRHLKKWIVAEPETKIFKIGPECEFIILASDGLWDKVDSQEAVDVIRRLCVGVDKPEHLSACKELADLSIARGSADDISIMVVSLGFFG